MSYHRLGDACRQAWPAQLGNQCASLTRQQQQGLGPRARPCLSNCGCGSEGVARGPVGGAKRTCGVWGSLSSQVASD